MIGDDEEIGNNEDVADAVGETVDDYTHISGDSIGKQGCENKVGREGDEVGSLAQGLEAWWSKSV